MAERNVASEDNLRTALRQQLIHNENQNLVMTRMSRSLSGAGRMAGDIRKLLNKVNASEMSVDKFFEEVDDRITRFEVNNARGNGLSNRK